MITKKPRLGTLETSEQLLSDIYVDFRKKIRYWAAITQQTAQVRMSYVGQHLVSVVTGFPGGRSGARGRDLLLPGGDYAEIKTCTRVDQLGECNKCHAAVASIEEVCPSCESPDIQRDEDSKWLIGIRNDDEFAETLRPRYYYLVLCEFVDMATDRSVKSTIWQLKPDMPGFALCMVDYYLNIRTKSSSKAPFNLWPYQLEFDLMAPQLIYESIISTDDKIKTVIFPGRDKPALRTLRPLVEYARSRNLTLPKIQAIARRLGVESISSITSKRELLAQIQSRISSYGPSPNKVADIFAEELYLPGIKSHIPSLPKPLKSRVKKALRKSK